MLLTKQRGVSLVELMVAITIGLILMAGVLSIFLSSKITYFSNEKMARLQESGRVALNLVSHDVRAAGYMGCARSVPFTSALNSSTSQLWNYSVPLIGFESDGSGGYAPALALGFALNPAPAPNSDIILVRTVRRDARVVRVEGDMATLTSPIVVTNTTPAPVATNQHMIITDCNASTVFQVRGYTAGSISHTSGGSNPGNATGNVGYPYRIGSRLARVQTLLYYVGNNALGEPGLYRQTGATASAELLVEGVEALQISYGEDTNNDRLADQYVSASAVTDWDDVISVNYSLLIRSDEVGTDVDSKSYQLLTAGVGGITIAAAGDRRSRLMFTTTVALRNRAL